MNKVLSLAGEGNADYFSSKISLVDGELHIAFDDGPSGNIELGSGPAALFEKLLEGVGEMDCQVRAVAVESDMSNNTVGIFKIQVALPKDKMAFANRETMEGLHYLSIQVLASKIIVIDSELFTTIISEVEGVDEDGHPKTVDGSEDNDLSPV